MKQLSFVFAATAGIALVAGTAEAATRYSGTSGRRVETTPRHNIYDNYKGCDFEQCYPAPEPVPVVIMQEPPKPAPAPAPAKPKEPRKQNSLTLADPFFQPLAGRVGLLADIGLAWNSYKFEVSPGQIPWGGINGNWKANEFFVQPTISFGITDELAVLGGIKYANTRYSLHNNAFNAWAWDPILDDWIQVPVDADTVNARDSGIAIWSLGLQWKFYEDDEWVANLQGSFNSAEIANNLLLAGKLGYKVNLDTMVYGLANLSYIMWKESSYGNGVIDDTGQVVFIAFDADASNSIYGEVGAGVFHKFTDRWSFDLQGVFGDYAWHSQIWTKAAIYFQATDHFALGLYGRTSLWDSANKTDGIFSWCKPGATECIGPYTAGNPPLWWTQLGHSAAQWNPLDPHCMGQTTLSNYRDIQVGLNLLLYF